MDVSQLQWTSHTGLRPETGESEEPPHLVFLFGSRAALQDGASIAAIHSRFPDAIFIGCSTAGEILDTRIYDDTVSVTAVHFETTRVTAASVAIDCPAESYSAGTTLARSLSRDGLVHLFVLSDGLHVNGSELVKGLSDNLARYDHPLRRPVRRRRGVRRNFDRFRRRSAQQNDRGSRVLWRSTGGRLRIAWRLGQFRSGAIGHEKRRERSL